MQVLSPAPPPGPTPRMREPLRFRQVTLAPAHGFFRLLALSDVHHRSNKLEFTRLISFSMSHNVDIFDKPIRHQQAMLKIKILSVPRRPLNSPLHESYVFRMNPLENKFCTRFRRSVVLEDSKGFFC